MESLGISGDTSFVQMSEGEKTDVGVRLAGLLRVISKDALVPLLNRALGVDEVKKLASLKGVRCSEEQSVVSAQNSIKNELNDGSFVKEESEDDNDEVMAIVAADQMLTTC